MAEIINSIKRQQKKLGGYGGLNFQSLGEFAPSWMGLFGAWSWLWLYNELTGWNSKSGDDFHKFKTLIHSWFWSGSDYVKTGIANGSH